MTMGRALAVLLAALAAPAGALEQAAWPPPPAVQERMHELQAVMRDPAVSAAQRETARAELSALLKSPAGQQRGRTPDERKARAAIEPFPSVVKREAGPSVPQPGVAHLEVLAPPKPVVIPETGSVALPSGRFAIDPRTGHVLHEVPGGYVDPATGRFTPR